MRKLNFSFDPRLQPGVIGHVGHIENRLNGLPEPGPFARLLDRFGKPLKRFGEFERAQLNPRLKPEENEKEHAPQVEVELPHR